MAPMNGKAEIKPAEVTDRALLEILLEAVRQLTEQVEEVKDNQQELRESIANISTPGVNFGFDDDDDYEES